MTWLYNQYSQYVSITSSLHWSPNGALQARHFHLCPPEWSASPARGDRHEGGAGLQRDAHEALALLEDLKAQRLAQVSDQSFLESTQTENIENTTKMILKHTQLHCYSGFCTAKMSELLYHHLLTELQLRAPSRSRPG